MSTSIEEFSTALPSVIDQLRSAVAGSVHAPGTGGYDLAVAPFNLAAVHHPAAVVVASSAADVAATVRIARRVGKKIAVFATGHGAAAATPDSIMINTSLLDNVVIDPQAKLATVGAGVRWQRVLDEATPHGLAALCGSAPDAGVVGVTLGGGMGPIARTMGFAADHVTEIEVVTGDGTLRRINASTDPDLFFAIRGGGAAFGIVTQITFRLFEIQTLHAGGLFFDIVDAARVVHGWREWVQQIPESVSSSIAILNLPPLEDLPEPLRGRSVVHVRYAHVGDVENDDALVTYLRCLGTPILDNLTEIMYADIAAIHADPTDPLPVMERSVLLRELPVEAVDEFLAVALPSGGLPLILTEIRAMGGAMSRQPEVPNAVVGRDAAFNLFTLGPDVPDLHDVLPGALESVLGAMTPYATGAALPGFAGEPTGEPAKRVMTGWGPETLTRLVAIRDQYDLERIFAGAARW
jgi:UDP-N-acetylenolpyruvoylglucosamine reductase